MWNGSDWVWRLSWRRSSFDREELQRGELLIKLIEGVLLCPNAKDKLIWKYAPDETDFLSQIGTVTADEKSVLSVVRRVNLHHTFSLNVYAFGASGMRWRDGGVWVSVWIKAKNTNFPYSAADLLRSADGVKRWSRKSRLRRQLQWTKPPNGWLKWNVDGFSLGKPGRSGIGGILRDSYGFILCIISAPMGMKESNEAEVIALRRALQNTGSSPGADRLRLIVELDSSNAYTWVTKNKGHPWRLSADINMILALQDRFAEPLGIIVVWLSFLTI
ncbi:hypothetical protein CRG98_045448 [Punica granatum]|uniref:RNase H type-1 domain-containing protein n=1 Tax=Punica granatum TaxID=22663 RepID=A0A2I0HR30_PUNGR|nr:hypothetical protein CRG98_045448 [Punica granatum]